MPNVDRIKGLRKKTLNPSVPFDDLIPFGTDGQFVDLFDGLNLNEELLIGGAHSISVTTETEDDSEIIVITDECKVGNPSSVVYVVQNKIYDTETGNIIRTTLFGSDGTTVLKEKTTTIIGDQIEEVLE